MIDLLLKSLWWVKELWKKLALDQKAPHLMILWSDLVYFQRKTVIFQPVIHPSSPNKPSAGSHPCFYHCLLCSLPGRRVPFYPSLFSVCRAFSVERWEWSILFVDYHGLSQGWKDGRNQVWWRQEILYKQADTWVGLKNVSVRPLVREVDASFPGFRALCEGRVL